MQQIAPIVFLLDVDNTLLDNDQVIADLRAHLTATVGIELQACYWRFFEERRSELGYADYLGALQRYRAENQNDPNFLQISLFLMNYPFATRLYPDSLKVLKHLQQWGPTVIVSDGDAVFQPLKVARSGLFDAVGERVLIYIHKEQQLDDIEAKYPAQHYAFVDDKLRLLSAFKGIWGSRVTTVFPRQGHYAHDSQVLAAYPPADLTVDGIGDLLRFGLQDFVGQAVPDSAI